NGGCNYGGPHLTSAIITDETRNHHRRTTMAPLSRPSSNIHDASTPVSTTLSPSADHHTSVVPSQSCRNTLCNSPLLFLSVTLFLHFGSSR
ncbi:hypothetical protein U1Q18_041502, partial [Sarracenia purpurea var. burkii]